LYGVGVVSGTGDRIEGNSIYGNGQLGIVVGATNHAPPGPIGVATNAANDAANHMGPNDLMNFPVLSSASSSASDTTISGTLDTGTANGQPFLPNTTFTLDFYANPTEDSSGYGQGQTFLGSAQITTDASGNASFSVDFGTGNLAGQWISATATDEPNSTLGTPGGNTSEFSADVPILAPSQTFAQFLPAALPQSSTQPNSLTIVAGPSTMPATVIQAVNGLTNVAQLVTITLDLGGDTYTGGVVADPPTNVALVIQNGTLTKSGTSAALTIAGGNVTTQNLNLDPNAPAMTVTGGQVSILDSTLTTSCNAPTLLVTGGSVTLRNDHIIQASTVFTDPAISVTGGTVNLGTAANPGNNTLSVNSSGDLVSNTTGNAISAVGDTFVVGGTMETAQSLSFSSLASSAASSVFGQAVTFTATVVADLPGSPAPTGSVLFVDATTGTTLGTVSLSGGTASVSTSALAAGTHVIVASYSGDGNFLPSAVTLTQTVAQATPAFSLSGPQVIQDGTGHTALSGLLTDGSLIPTGSVTVTVNGASQTVPPGSDGSFSATFNTASLGVGSLNIAYSYGGDANFTAASATGVLDVTYGILTLYDTTKAKNAGSTLPVQIELVSVSGQDVSSSSVTVKAVGIAPASNPSAIQPAPSPGNSDPGGVFQFHGGKQPSYQFNLKIPDDLAAGTYLLFFTVAGDPVQHSVQFTVR
jgi:hypothetical protein